MTTKSKNKTARRNDRRNAKSNANGKNYVKKNFRPSDDKHVFVVWSDAEADAVIESEYGPRGPQGLIDDLLAGTVKRLPKPSKSMEFEVQSFTLNVETYADLLCLSAARRLSIHGMIQEDLFGTEVRRDLHTMLFTPQKELLHEAKALRPDMTDGTIISTFMGMGVRAYLRNQWWDTALEEPDLFPTELNWHILDADGSPCCGICPEERIAEMKDMLNRLGKQDAA